MIYLILATISLLLALYFTIEYLTRTAGVIAIMYWSDKIETVSFGSVFSYAVLSITWTSFFFFTVLYFN